MTLQFPTIADCIGNTPLVRLQRLGGETSNTLLVKLEGNNPAGSVKDRPALSMINRAGTAPNHSNARRWQPSQVRTLWSQTNSTYW